jgi:SAM-dependent methyltransferase
MDPALRQGMLAYYDERAAEYEQAYTAGTGTSSIADPHVFTAEAAALAGVVSAFGHGHFIDIACGTGYWLPSYAARCSHITLVDQSPNMLRECGQKVSALGIADRCELLVADVLDLEFPSGVYDSALIGFLISHLSEAQERTLFDGLRRTLRPTGRFLILDSAWTEMRARFNEKVSAQGRQLNDGSAFVIYKRYIDRDDIAGWGERYGLTTRVEYFGSALCAVSGAFDAA